MLHLRSLAVGLMVAVAMHSWLPASSYGQTVIDWIFPNSGLYSTSSNWSSSSVPNSTESAQFNISSTYGVFLATNRTVSDLLVGAGDVTFRASSAATADITYTMVDDVLINGGSLTLTENLVNGFNLNLAVTDDIVINDGQLNIEVGSQVTNSGFGTIGDSSSSVGTATVTGAGSIWNSGAVSVGEAGQGTLNIEAGGQVISSAAGNIGNLANSVGTATVTGAGSIWTAVGFVVGRLSQGTLNVEAGGQVISGGSIIGLFSGSSGDVTVTGTGSTWTNSGDLTVGQSVPGTLTISAGGQVSNLQAFVALNSSSVSTVTVSGTGSTWTSTDLFLGLPSLSGQATLNINNGGLVTATSTNINFQSAVVLNGGRFEFGVISADAYDKISGTSGELAGDYSTAFNGFNALSSIDLSIANLDTSEVRFFNDGVIFGGGVVPHALANTSTGELRTFAGEWARFSGTSNTNAGEINNFEGVVEFVQGITNEATGFVGGRGQFIANGGWTNEGVMAFSGGFADVLGDVANSATGQIVVGGGSVTTFFDDVTMDAANLNVDVALSSTAVFLGSYNGGNDGAGTIEVLGDLRPGNSPAEVTFGGDLTLGSGANTFIELAGTALGEFDRLDVAGDLSLDGDLMVSLFLGFDLDMAMEFIIAQVDGTLSGTFANFDDGDLVGTFGGTDLFIDYDGGDGNDVALFTAGLAGDFDLDEDVDGADFLAWQRDFGTTYNADDLDDWQTNYGTAPGAIASATSTSVPEPSTLVLCLGLAGLFGVVRRRQK